jgi:hypothetical protein
MISAKLPRPSVTRSAKVTEMRANQDRAAEALLRQEGVAHVDDGDREAQRPGQLRNRRGVVSGAEDHEFGRRRRDS